MKRVPVYQVQADDENKEGYPPKPVITIAKSFDNEYSLRLVETKRYMLKLEFGDDDEMALPRFQNEDNKFLKLEKDKNSVAFQFINFILIVIIK